jgi:hypothetical protein
MILYLGPLLQCGEAGDGTGTVVDAATVETVPVLKLEYRATVKISQHVTVSYLPIYVFNLNNENQKAGFFK